VLFTLKEDENFYIETLYRHVTILFGVLHWNKETLNK